MAWTRKPCLGGAEKHRSENGQLCHNCERIMAAGREAIRDAAADQETVVTAVSENPAWAGMPRIYDDGATLWQLPQARIDRDSLGPVLIQFFLTLGTPQTGVGYNDLVDQVPTRGMRGVTWRSSQESHRGPNRRMARATAERVSGIVDLIALYLEYAHRLGYRRGASLLHALASGDLTGDTEEERLTGNDKRLVTLAEAINEFDPVEPLRTRREESGDGKN